MSNDIGYIASNYVVRLRSIPRFGHSTTIANLVAGSPSNTASAASADDYRDGIVAFCIFICTLLFTWGIVLLVLKYFYGSDVVGWAAGGRVVDVRIMRKQGIRKCQRKARILRNWKVQTAFLVVNCCIPMASFCLFQFGLNPFILSLEDIQEVNDIVDSKSFVATKLVSDLMKEQERLESAISTIAIFRDLPTLQDFCPSLVVGNAGGVSVDGIGSTVASETISTTSGTGTSTQSKNKNHPMTTNITIHGTQVESTKHKTINNDKGRYLQQWKDTTNEDLKKEKIVVHRVSGMEQSQEKKSIGRERHAKSSTLSSSSAEVALTTDFLLTFSQLNEQIYQELKPLKASNDQFGNVIKKDLLQLLYKLTNVTASVDEGIDFMYNNDWIVKLFITALNICVLFLIVGVLLTKNNIQWPAYHLLSMYCIIPAFSLLLVAVTVMTCLFVSAAVMNADFCAGGDATDDHLPVSSYHYSYVSPVNTLNDMLVLQGYGPNSILSQALHYYGTSCLTDNPLTFLNDAKSNITATRSALKELSEPFKQINSGKNGTFEMITKFCGSEGIVTFELAKETMSSLITTLENSEGSLQAAIDLTECSSISPILRRLMYGATCTTSVEGLTWLFATLLIITILGMMALTLRAALYNPLVRGRRQKRREKEWEDYKEFMSRFYNVSNWKIDPNNADVICSGTAVSCIDTFNTTTPKGQQPQEKNTNICAEGEYFDENQNDLYSVRYINNQDDDDNTLSIQHDNTNTPSVGSRRSLIEADSVAPTITTGLNHHKGNHTFVSLTTPDGESCLYQSSQFQQHHDDNDDDDDSYDSTYSSDSDDDRGGASITSSVASSFVRRLFLSRKKHGPLDQLLSLSSDNFFLGSFSTTDNHPSTNANTFDENSVAESSSLSLCDIPGNSPSTLYDTPKAPLSSYIPGRVHWNLNSNQNNYPNKFQNSNVSNFCNDPLNLGRHQMTNNRHDSSAVNNSTDNFGLFEDNVDDDNYDQENVRSELYLDDNDYEDNNLASWGAASRIKKKRPNKGRSAEYPVVKK